MAFEFFDDIHKGHDKVFDILNEIAEARSLKKAVMTFNPHPSVMLDPRRKRTTYLTPLSDKIEKISQHDIDYCIVVNFSSRFANMSVEDFVESYMIENNVKEVVVGFDFTFGKFRKDNMTALQKYDTSNMTIVSRQEIENEKISTTSIRQDLINGELQKANDVLDYVYSIEGTIV